MLLLAHCSQDKFVNFDRPKRRWILAPGSADSPSLKHETLFIELNYLLREFFVARCEIKRTASAMTNGRYVNK